MKFTEIKNILFREAKRAGLEDYDIYFRVSDSISADALGKKPNSFSFGTSGGVCFRCAVNGKLGTASTQYLEEGKLESLVAHAVANAAVIESAEEPIFFEGAPAQSYRALKRELPDFPGVAELRRVTMELQAQMYAASPMMTDGTCSAAGATRVSVAYANSKGVELSHEFGTVTTYVEPVIHDGKEPSFGSAMAQTLATDTDIVKTATEEAIARLGATTVKTGKYDVIFDRRRVRSLLSAYTGIFSGKAALQGLSLLKGKEGEQIASEKLTLVDDPFYKENPVKCAFDAEGVPTKEKTLIENGVLKTLLYDLTNARKAGVTTTGNAARGYADPVSVAPYCLRIEAGEETREELIARMGDGLYVTEMKGLHAGANAVTGDFSIESAGFLVENGKLTCPVHSFTVAGNFFELLKAIDGVASNVEMGAPARSAIAAPDILVRGLSVAGE
jgi:PmbA protein